MLHWLTQLACLFEQKKGVPKIPCDAIAVVTIETACSATQLCQAAGIAVALQEELPEGWNVLQYGGPALSFTSPLGDKFVYANAGITTINRYLEVPEILVKVIQKASGIVAQGLAAQKLRQGALVTAERWQGDTLHLTLVLDGKRSRAVLESSGEVHLYVDEGDYPTASRTLGRAVDGLARDLQVTRRGKVEAHRHPGQLLQNQLTI